MRGLIATGLVLLVGASLLIGAADLWSGDLGTGFLVAVSRLPRTAAALLAGAGLALAGVVVQLTVQNRLVEPGLTGTPEAAMLGLLGVTLIAPGAAILIKMSVAAVTALMGTAGFLWLSRHVPRRDPILLPLVGIIYGGILGAVVLWAAWVTDLVQYLGVWQSGEFSGVLRGRYELLWIIAALGAALYLAADRITILGLGEDYARSLGLDYRQTLALGLVIVSVTVSAVVVTVGSLPFVGLVVPNIVSRWRGDNLRRNLPVIALLGGTLVLAADVLGRVVRWPYEIPAGTIFAVFGAGLFLWLLNSAPRRGEAGHG
ncbi:iron chelate uptake ABC transporter family permease subunit [Histidinibacterium aquaticum]|uniref:Iron chelate uptake ABC transporter family permease subunit n=1 Tax=Histidinibacterium aquaticum TaxID=2613962 RepID=A0A5J5GHW5_9RHOB|nr:iron chelate uptake ABC transporter family permease subunit [Histidinibacterium aquaticum]KAA9007826.1 iron chelate uptake ABC transporter family permease subunit [Histidinibacterium aquaticum]